MLIYLHTMFKKKTRIIDMLSLSMQRGEREIVTEISAKYIGGLRQ